MITAVSWCDGYLRLGVWGALCLGVCGMVSHTVFSNCLIIRMIVRVVCQTLPLKQGSGTVYFVRCW